MRKPATFGFAVLASASLAFAGGEGEKNKGGEKSKPETTTPSILKDGQWSGGLGKMKYTNGDFSLKLKNRIQVQLGYTNKSAGADTTGAAIKRSRTSLSGNVTKTVKYKLQNEWLHSASIKDAWLDWELHRTDSYAMGLRFGQMKTAFGRDFNTSSGNLQFVDRGLASKAFTGKRTRAVMLHGTTKGGSIGWSFGLSNGDMAGAAANSGEEGDGRNAGNSTTTPSGAFANDDADNEVNWTIEVHWSSNPEAVNLNAAQGHLGGDGGWGCGAAYFIGNGRHVPNPAVELITDVETGSINAWVEVKNANGIAATAEFFDRTESSDAGGADADAMGYQVSVTWTAAQMQDQAQWGVGMRWSYIENDSTTAGYLLSSSKYGMNAAGNERGEFEIGVNRFDAGHRFKTQLSIRSQGISGAGDNIAAVLQTTLSF